MIKNKHLRTFYLIVAIASTLIVVIGFNRPKPISSVTQKEKFWADKTHSDGKYGVIFLGDSRLYRGIDAQSVSKELQGLKVLNFGYSSGGHNDIIFKEAEKRLESSKGVRAMVLVLTPYSLTPKAQENGHFRQEADRNPKEVFQRRYINPILSFLDPIKPSEIVNTQDSLPGYYEDFRKHGWVASKKFPVNPEQALKSYVNNFDGNVVQESILNLLYQQVGKWARRGIQVFAFRMPSTNKMEELENGLSGYNENRIKIDFEKSGGEWISIESKYDYDSYDGSHLDESSALRFSKYIGQELQKKLIRE